MFSDYVIYADESGDHNLSKIDADYPVFALSLCVFKKRDYVRNIVPHFQELKFKWFGHDAVVFHEREIRKQHSPFQWLANEEKRNEFFQDLENALNCRGFKIISSVIDKRRVREDLFPENPYSIALRYCMEEVFKFLKINGEENKSISFIFEKRGRKEDDELELEFRRVSSGQNRYRVNLTHFDIIFVDKKANSTGLQIADLTARPIGLSVFRPLQMNRAFDVINGRTKSCRRRYRALHVLSVFP